LDSSEKPAMPAAHAGERSGSGSGAGIGDPSGGCTECSASSMSAPHEWKPTPAPVAISTRPTTAVPTDSYLPYPKGLRKSGGERDVLCA
jgi:hypothetical protein